MEDTKEWQLDTHSYTNVRKRVVVATTPIVSFLSQYQLPSKLSEI